MTFLQQPLCCFLTDGLSTFAAAITIAAGYGLLWTRRVPKENDR